METISPVVTRTQGDQPCDTLLPGSGPGPALRRHPCALLLMLKPCPACKEPDAAAGWCELRERALGSSPQNSSPGPWRR